MMLRPAPLLLLLAAAAATAAAVDVTSELELLAALEDPDVTYITLQSSIRLSKPGRRVRLDHNLTISGPLQPLKQEQEAAQPGQAAATAAGSAAAAAAAPPAVLDVAHQAGVLLVGPGVLLTLQRLVLHGSVITWAPGLAFVDHLPGARVRLVHVVRPNPLCPPDPSWLAAGMQSTPVPPQYSPPGELFDISSRGPFANHMVLWGRDECRAQWVFPEECRQHGGFTQHLAYEMPTQLDNRLVYSYRDSMGLYEYFSVYFPCYGRADQRCVAAKGYPVCFNQQNARLMRQAAWANSKGSVATSTAITVTAICMACLWWWRQQQRQQQAQQQQQQQSTPGRTAAVFTPHGYIPDTSAVQLISGPEPFGLAAVVSGSSTGALSEVTFGSLIGAGSFGRVYRGSWKGSPVAVKVIEMPASSSIKSVRQELDIGTRMQHHHLVQAPASVCSDDSTSWPAQAISNAGNSSSPRSCGGQPQLHQQQQQQQLPPPQQQSQPPPQQRLPQGRGPIVWSPVATSDPSLAEPDSQRVNNGNPMTQVLMLLEFCDGGSLHAAAMSGLLRGTNVSGGSSRCNNMVSVLRVALDVAKGMQHLHSHKVVHGDLTSHNILLSSSSEVPEPLRYIAKVADFGSSRLLPEHGTHLTTAMHGTITHQAPEVLQTGRIRLASDVYSFGVLLWELVHLGIPQQASSNPDADLTSSNSSTAVIHGVYQHMSSLRASWLIAQQVVEGMRPEFVAPAVPGPYVALAKRCWNTDLAERPTFTEVVGLLEGYVHGHRQSLSEGSF